MRLIVGLGNPGRQYRRSRHNAGFWCLDRMSQDWGISIRERRAKVVLGQGLVGSQEVVLAKPRTYVNRSGDGAIYLLDRFHASPEDLLIVYDDMALPVGKIRLRPGGGAGGHNGLKSIIGSISSQNVPRLRVGIGKPAEDQDDVSFVLGSFGADERSTMARAVERAAGATSCLIEEGLQEAMTRFNGS